ncbi:hypothetical protein IV203_030082 [Nitzschia inconspicua]|uniref:Uncharacterized protein n=1 Tax=Nitzschia inconspicua TaxID=303405 RepID=A0A9K3LVF9_9STRA|nr:hypothetical protein IV203_030082 [Nitzschia inconspicua]
MTSTSGLSPEEESMLKTALAFVIINSRSRKRSLAEDDNAQDNSSTRHGQQHPSQSLVHASAELPPTPIFGGLFDDTAETNSSRSCSSQQKTPQKNAFQGSLTSVPKVRFLQCTDDDHHSMHIFRAARSLAKTLLAKQRSDKKNRNLVGGGLTTNCKFPRDDEVALAGTAGHLASQLQQLLHRHQTSLAAKTSSSVAPRSSKTNPDKRSSKLEKQQPKKLSPHEWIRTSLLESIEIQDKDKVVNSLKEDTLDMLAAFHVYHVMIPQLASRCPALVTIVFQIATKLIRELYDDKFVVPNRQHERPSEHMRTLDSLAVSALRLMEACWTSKRLTPKETKMLRSTMLNELQTNLVDLTVPSLFQNIPKLLCELSAKKRLHMYQLRLEARISARGETVQGSLLSARPRYQGRLPKHTLDPVAKVMVRVAVFRLLLLR